jgi:hypothetical protein
VSAPDTSPADPIQSAEQSLFQFDGGGSRPLTERVAALNPDAGSHPIPSDPREIRAALLAGAASWERFSYYRLRYGDRGRRFTHSDSAWLVTLTQLDQAEATSQILWLGRVLASRGMPQWLLEQHLLLLCDELSRAVPDRRANYDKLRVAASTLAAVRRRYLRDDDFDAVAAAFAGRVGATAAVPEAGRLLAAAVTDERAGVANAVESLEEWLTAPGRFPAPWAEAVRATIRAARARIV